MSTLLSTAQFSYNDFENRFDFRESIVEESKILTLSSSHPASPNFGRHWTEEQVHETFAPAKDTIQAVLDWLISSGIEDTAIIPYENKGWFGLDLPAWQAEELFQTKYHEHIHSTSGQVRVGCDE